MTPEQFAAHLCIDLDLPERYEYFIVASMKRQIYHYTQVKNKFKTKQREQIIIVKVRKMVSPKLIPVVRHDTKWSIDCRPVWVGYNE